MSDEALPGGAHDHLCCGLRVRSFMRLPWDETDRAGEPEITVRAGTVAAPPGVGPEAFFGRDEMTLVIPGTGRFRASGGDRIVVDVESSSSPIDVLLYLCGSVFGAIWLQRGLLPLHGSTVSSDVGSVMFVGPSGAGKSSLAAHFASAGWRLVADDVSVIRPTVDGPGVWPGSGHMKLSRDAAASIRQDPEVLPPVGGTRGKVRVTLASNGRRAQPLRRIYLLSGWGALASTNVGGLDAVDVIGGHTYRQEFVEPMGVQQRWFDEVVRVARSVPVRRLVRPHGFENVGEAVRFVEQDLSTDES